MGGSFDANWIPQRFLIHGDPADASPRNYFKNGDFYTTVSSVPARNLFTTAFVILNLFNSVVGVYLLQWRNAAKLLKKQHPQTVPLYTLSPWMSASDILTYFWNTHHLPGGHYGLFMLMYIPSLFASPFFPCFQELRYSQVEQDIRACQYWLLENYNFPIWSLCSSLLEVGIANI